MPFTALTATPAAAIAGSALMVIMSAAPRLSAPACLAASRVMAPGMCRPSSPSTSYTSSAAGNTLLPDFSVSMAMLSRSPARLHLP